MLPDFVLLDGMEHDRNHGVHLPGRCVMLMKMKKHIKHQTTSQSVSKMPLQASDPMRQN